MDVCSRCGGSLIFRNVNGHATPVHLSGGCRGSGGGRGRDWSEDFCFATRCRQCRASVYLVRHNGGTVLLDDLGPPWPKHPCYDDRATRAFATFAGASATAAGGVARLGIVTGTRYLSASASRVDVCWSDRKRGGLDVAGVHPPAAGSLVVMTSTDRMRDSDGFTYELLTTPPPKPNARRAVPPAGATGESDETAIELLAEYITYAPPKPAHAPATPKRMVACPHCTSSVREDRMNRHLRIIHGIGRP